MSNYCYQKNLSKIKYKTAKIAIIGLGYVGLSLSLDFESKGFLVVGYDVDTTKVNSLNNKTSYLSNIKNKQIKNAKNATWTNNKDYLEKSDVYFICVPTPIDSNKKPILDYIISAGEIIKKTIKKGNLVILQSTSYPGTTEDVLKPIIDKSDLEVEKDYFLAFSSERVDPGNAKFGSTNTPRVVGGCGKYSTKLASKTLEYISPIHVVSSPRNGEMSKILENSFRLINISFINEMALLSKHIGVNIWEAIEAASTKPFGFMPFYPRAGIGGHCIPVDPYYLQHLAQINGLNTKHIELFDDIDKQSFDKAINIITKNGVPKNALIVGMSYKKNINDLRQSPSIKLAKIMIDLGISVCYYDEYFGEINIETKKGIISLNKYTPNDTNQFDVAIISVHHDHCTNKILKSIIDSSSQVLDTQNYLAKLGQIYINSISYKFETLF
jgi:UDP-N-acetyl-D-glucosamine dehydrogenase